MICISWWLCALAVNSVLLKLLPIGWAEGNYLELLRVIAIAVGLWFVQSRVKLSAWLWIAAPQAILVMVYLLSPEVQELSTHIALFIGFLPLAVRQLALNRYGDVEVS